MRLRDLSGCCIRLWVWMAMLLQGVAFTFLPAGRAGVPGGRVVAEISDEFDTLKPIWVPGLRGMPEVLTIHDGLLSVRSVDNGDDAYPSAEDMLCTYADQIGRPLAASERPSIVAQVWFPPFDQWPAGTNAAGAREWFGLRVTAYDADLPYNSGNYWPGIYVATDDEGPCFIARVGDGFSPDYTIGRIPAAGWWTLGISWNKEGRLECYAAPGRVTLTRNDLLHTTPDQPTAEANRSLDHVEGTFIALRMTYPADRAVVARLDAGLRPRPREAGRHPGSRRRRKCRPPFPKCRRPDRRVVHERERRRHLDAAAVLRRSG